MDNVPKEPYVVSVMTHWSLETVALVRDEKDDRLHPHPIRRQRPTARDKNPQKNQATKRKALQTKGAKFHAFGTLPYVRLYKSEKG